MMGYIRKHDYVIFLKMHFNMKKERHHRYRSQTVDKVFWIIIIQGTFLLFWVKYSDLALNRKKLTRSQHISCIFLSVFSPVFSYSGTQR